MSCDHFSVGWARLADERGVASYAVWWGLTLAAPNAASPHNMWKPTLTTEKTRLSVTDLRAGEEYMVRVAAVYEGEPSGIGAWSEPLRITTVAYGGQECVSPDESSCTRCRVAVACYTGPGCESSPPPLPPPPPRPPPPSPPKGPIGEELSAESFFSLQGLYGRSSDYLKATSFGSSKNGGGGGGNSVVAGAKGAAAADTSARVVGGGGTKHGGTSGLSPESLEMIIMGGLLLGACIALVWCSVGSLFGTGSRRRRGGKWERAAIDESDDDDEEADDAGELPTANNGGSRPISRVEANEIFLTALQDAASEPPAPVVASPAPAAAAPEPAAPAVAAPEPAPAAPKPAVKVKAARPRPKIDFGGGSDVTVRRIESKAYKV